MQQSGIPAYYYPTTVVCVDDSKDFLMNFSLQLDPGLSYRLFDSPHLALNWVQQLQDNPLLQRCFSQYSEAVVGCPTTNHTIKLDISLIQREVYNATRFNEVSVMVVDFAMPDINGLELCERFKDRPLKKILLTGQGDAHTAVDAFNRGIIDRFLLKSDPDVIEKINTAINDLQRQYFREKSDFMVKALAIDSPNFLQDPSFCAMFNQLCRERNVVEYYLAENTGTFLLLTSHGKAFWLIVCTQQDIDMYCELGKDTNVPQDVLEGLQSGNYLIHFWQTRRTYDIDPIEWESYLYPAKKVKGLENYYYTVVENPSISQLDAEGIFSYHSYLEHLDNANVMSGA